MSSITLALYNNALPLECLFEQKGNYYEWKPSQDWEVESSIDQQLQKFLYQVNELRLSSGKSNDRFQREIIRLQTIFHKIIFLNIQLEKQVNQRINQLVEERRTFSIATENQEQNHEEQEIIPILRQVITLERQLHTFLLWTLKRDEPLNATLILYAYVLANLKDSKPLNMLRMPSFKLLDSFEVIYTKALKKQDMHFALESFEENYQLFLQALIEWSGQRLKIYEDLVQTA